MACPYWFGLAAIACVYGCDCPKVGHPVAQVWFGHPPPLCRIYISTPDLTTHFIFGIKIFWIFFLLLPLRKQLTMAPKERDIALFPCDENTLALFLREYEKVAKAGLFTDKSISAAKGEAVTITISKGDHYKSS